MWPDCRNIEWPHFSGRKTTRGRRGLRAVVWVAAAAAGQLGVKQQMNKSGRRRCINGSKWVWAGWRVGGGQRWSTGAPDPDWREEDGGECDMSWWLSGHRGRDRGGGKKIKRTKRNRCYKRRGGTVRVHKRYEKREWWKSRRGSERQMDETANRISLFKTAVCERNHFPSTSEPCFI